MATQNLGWNLDWTKFRNYLKIDFNVDTAYLFIGYMPEHQEIYSAMQKAGYIVIFKPVTVNREGDVKGNIDAELVLQCMIDFDRYDKAVIVSGDGDFSSLVSHLSNKNKLAAVIIPNQRQFSPLLKQASKDNITFLNNMRHDLEYRRFNNNNNNNNHKPQPRTTEPTAEAKPAAEASVAAAPSPATPAPAPRPQQSSRPLQSRPSRRSSPTNQLEDSIINATSAPKEPVRQTRPTRRTKPDQPTA